MHPTTTTDELATPTSAQHVQPRPVPSRRRLPRTLRGDRGEGVISTAIAVLVMSFLGAAMWVTFQSVWKDTSAATERQVQIIGSESGR